MGNIEADLNFDIGSVPGNALYGELDGDVVFTGDIDANVLVGSVNLELNFEPSTVPANALYGTLSTSVLPANIIGNGYGLTSLNLANTSGMLAVSKGGSGTTTSTGTGNLVLSDAPTLNGNVTVSGNVIAKGIVRNIYTQSNTTTFASITTSYIDGPIFNAVTMSANSKVKVYVYIPWRNGNTTGTFGGMLVDVQFRVNVNVGSYVANSWVSLGISGYQMITGAEEMLQYTNEFYLPFTIPSDFTLQVKYRVASYDGTASIGNGYNSYLAGNVLLAQFGILDSQMYPKIIITEIGG